MSKKMFEVSKMQDAFAVENLFNVRLGTRSEDGKKVTYVGSATKFPKGFTVRSARKAVGREMAADAAMESLRTQASGLNVPSERVFLETNARDNKAVTVTKTVKAPAGTKTAKVSKPTGKVTV